MLSWTTPSSGREHPYRLQAAADACRQGRYSSAQLNLISGRDALSGVGQALTTAMTSLGRELENHRRQSAAPREQKLAITDSMLPKRLTAEQLLAKLVEIRRDIDNKDCADRFPDGGRAEADCRLKAHRRYVCEVTYKPSLAREMCIANSQY